MQFVIRSRLLRIALHDMRHTQRLRIQLHVPSLLVRHRLGTLLDDRQHVYLIPRHTGILAAFAAISYPADHDMQTGFFAFPLHVRCSPQVLYVHARLEEHMPVFRHHDLTRTALLQPADDLLQ